MLREPASCRLGNRAVASDVTDTSEAGAENHAVGLHVTATTLTTDWTVYVGVATSVTILRQLDIASILT